MSEQGSARIWRCSLSFASKQDRVAVLFVALAEWYGVMAGKKSKSGRKWQYYSVRSPPWDDLVRLFFAFSGVVPSLQWSLPCVKLGAGNPTIVRHGMTCQFFIEAFVEVKDSRMQYGVLRT